jgi:protein-disulfide isomerase
MAKSGHQAFLKDSLVNLLVQMRRLMKVFRSVVFAVCAVIACVSCGFAADGSSLKPPKGASVAIHVFEDLECPHCGHAYPLVWAAGDSHHVPVVLHDFPLPQHTWAAQAAIWGRYFDGLSKKSPNLGNDFRGYIYENQSKIDAANPLQGWVDKFCKDRKLVAPQNPDPNGKLKALIDADVELGKKIGLHHTPTILVVSINPDKPYTEVDDHSKIAQAVEDMQNALPKPTSTPAVKHKASSAKKTKPAPSATPA